jgi:hypothetical protein
MSTRETHKIALKNVLETITNFDVYPFTKLDNGRWPYAFITHGQSRSNKNGKLLNRYNYERVRTYYINVVFMLKDDTVAALNDLELQAGEYEDMILDILTRASTLNNGVWQDINVVEISSPWSGSDVKMNQNTLLITFQVDIESIDSYDAIA